MKNSLKSVKFFIWLELTLALSSVFSTKNAQYILQQEGRNTFLSPCRWKLAESSPQLPGRGSQKLDRRRKASGPTLWNKGDTAVDKLSKCNEQESFKLYYRKVEAVSLTLNRLFIITKKTNAVGAVARYLTSLTKLWKVPKVLVNPVQGLFLQGCKNSEKINDIGLKGISRSHLQHTLIVLGSSKSE